MKFKIHNIFAMLMIASFTTAAFLVDTILGFCVFGSLCIWASVAYHE